MMNKLNFNTYFTGSFYPTGKINVFLLFSLMFGCQILSGQSTSLIGAGVDASSLSTAQFQKYQKYVDQPYAQSIQLVQIAPNNLNFDNGYLAIYLPGTSQPIHYSMRNCRPYINGDYSWAGQIVPESEPESESTCLLDGEILLVKTGDAFYGEFNINENYYRLEGLGKNIAVLTTLDLSYFEEPVCATPSLPDSINNVVEGRGENSNCPVKVLVLYTEAALSDAPNAPTLGAVGVASTQSVLSNSLVAEAELQIQLVATLPLTNADWQEPWAAQYMNPLKLRI